MLWQADQGSAPNGSSKWMVMMATAGGRQKHSVPQLN